VERNHASPVALPAAAASEALPIALLALGIASAASDLGSVLVKTPFLRSGVTAGDLIEGTGVYVVLALFAWVVRLALPGHGRPAALAAIAAVTFAFGHGIHLAANSIHDSLQRGRIPDPLGLADFWDEHAGHYLIDSGRILFAAALTWGVGGDARAGQAGTGGGARAGRSGDFAAGAGGFVFGWILFAASVEGQTVPLVLPAALLYAAWSVRGWRARGAAGGPARAILLFLATAAWTALLFFAVWWIWQRGFPEFTKVGILRSAT